MVGDTDHGELVIPYLHTSIPPYLALRYDTLRAYLLIVSYVTFSIFIFIFSRPLSCLLSARSSFLQRSQHWDFVPPLILTSTLTFLTSSSPSPIPQFLPPPPSPLPSPNNYFNLVESVESVTKQLEVSVAIMAYNRDDELAINTIRLLAVSLTPHLQSSTPIAVNPLCTMTATLRIVLEAWCLIDNLDTNEIPKHLGRCHLQGQFRPSRRPHGNGSCCPCSFQQVHELQSKKPPMAKSRPLRPLVS